MDLATEAPAVDRAPPPSSATDTSQPRERLSVRDSLRQSFAQHREDTERQDRDVSSREPSEEPDTGATDQEASTTDRDTSGDVDRSSDVDTGVETKADSAEEKEGVVPTSWSKEAKEIWNDIPERARAEIAKREKDMEKGVKAIKDKVNGYKEIDDALAPYIPVIQEFKKTPGQAVGQLFAWFDALAKNPDEAVPALLESYKYDPRRLVEKYWPGAMSRYAQMEQYIRALQQGQQPAQNGQAQPNGQANGQAQPQQRLDPEVQNYIRGIVEQNNALKQRIDAFESQVGQRFQAQDQYYEQQNAAKTQEMLEFWAKDKPYFDRVRVKMGHLLTPDPNTNQALIPLTPDGKVDLDEAYNQAVWLDAEVRQEILAKQEADKQAALKAKQEAAIKAQQDQAAKARRASASIATSAPGAEVSRKTSTGKGMSVRESLQQAMREVSER